MRLPLFAAALSLTLFLPPSYSQVAEKKDPVQEKLIQEAAQKGLPLSASVSVNGNVSVEAVLLPPIVTRHVFSKAVSDRFAAVELTISNRSHDAALVVHSIFIDYSRWLLSGTSANTVADCAPRAVGASTNPQARPNLPACGNPLESWQAETKPNQIAAAEYRLARGELLDRQQWTVRNVLIRSLELAGSVAAG